MHFQAPLSLCFVKSGAFEASNIYLRILMLLNVHSFPPASMLATQPSRLPVAKSSVNMPLAPFLRGALFPSSIETKL